MVGNVRKWWFWWVLVGILLRLTLMPITLHPDLWGHSFTAYFFAYKGIINIYDYLWNLPMIHPLVVNYGNSNGVRDMFIYPPLAYFTLGIFRFLLRPFSDPNFLPWLMENLSAFHTRNDLYWNIFLLKLPYLFIDLACAFLVSGLFDDLKKRKMALLFWLFNPITLYAAFMMGQFDIVPVFFTLLCLFFARRKRYSYAMVFLGLGGGYKMYPLFLVPVASFVFGRNIFERVKYFVLGLLPFILTIAPFLGSEAFRQMVILNPKSQKMLFMTWSLTGAEGIYPFILILFVIYFYGYYRGREIKLEKYFLAVLLLIFSVSHYHPQWFLWATPLLVWELVENSLKNWLLVLVLIACWLYLTFSFDSSLTYGLFNPVWSAKLTTGVNNSQFSSLARSLFAAASVFLVARNWNEK